MEQILQHGLERTRCLLLMELSKTLLYECYDVERDRAAGSAGRPGTTSELLVVFCLAVARQLVRFMSHVGVDNVFIDHV